MTKLNKIAQVLVLTGMSCWVSVAQAADVEISQSTKVNHQMSVSGQVDSEDKSTHMSAQSDTSVENDTQVAANTDESTTSEPESNESEENAEESQAGPSESEAQPSNSSSDVAASQMLENNSQLVAGLSNNAGGSVNAVLDATASSTTTLTQSLNQATSLPALPSLTAPSTPEEDAPSDQAEQSANAATNLLTAQSLDSNNQLVASLANNVGDNANVASTATATLAQSFEQVTSFNSGTELLALPETGETTNTDESMPNTEALSLAESSLAQGSAIDGSALDTAASIANSAEVTQQVAGNVQSLADLDAAAQTTQVLAQTVNANVADSITSSAQTAITENVNSQVNSAVAEQVNAEVAAATAAEVANNITNNLDIGL